MGPFQATAPMQVIQADLFDPCVASNGKKVILVIVDKFSKFCRLYAIKDKKANTVSDCLVKFIRDHGTPDIFESDGGPEFYNLLMVAICRMTGIKKQFGLAMRPQSQGQVERFN